MPMPSTLYHLHFLQVGRSTMRHHLSGTVFMNSHEEQSSLTVPYDYSWRLFLTTNPEDCSWRLFLMTNSEDCSWRLFLTTVPDESVGSVFQNSPKDQSSGTENDPYFQEGQSLTMVVDGGGFIARGGHCLPGDLQVQWTVNSEQWTVNCSCS